MEIVEECYECIMKRARGIINRGNFHELDNKRKIDQIETENSLIKAKQSWLLTKQSIICPAQLGTNRQKHLEEIGLGNTYKREKSLGKTLGKYLANQIEKNDVELTTAIKAALFGNGIEFDIGGNYVEPSLEKEWMKFTDLLVDKDIDNIIQQIVNKLYQTLEKGDLILYLLDNFGEHYLDLILIKVLVELGYQVEVVVKGQPVLNDICLDDNLDIFANFKVWDTKNSDVGLFLSRIPDNLLNRIKKSKLLVVKGMAQFETLSSEILTSPALYLLKAKCIPVANATKVKLDDYVIHFQNKEEPWMQ
jgi:uncharacterized protein with ATP-grasp and redox domains